VPGALREQQNEWAPDDSASCCRGGDAPWRLPQPVSGYFGVTPTFNHFAAQPLPHSRGTLAMVVVAHVAAALLIVQLVEARRYVEPIPLLVSLLPAPQQPPESSRELRPAPEPVPKVEFEPDPLPMPEPQPVERVVVPEPLLPKPIRVEKSPEPLPEKIVEPLPPPLPPEPSPRAITEVPIPPVPRIPEPVPEPLVALAPEPRPAVVAEPVPQKVIAAPVPELPVEVTMNSEMLTAIYLRNPKPRYPNLSRRLGEQGTVLLRVYVTVGGSATKVELKSSSGFPRLDRAAHDAVQSWLFVPAKRGEQAVDAWVVVPIKFSLKG
jgi:protein TonB